MPMLTMLAAPVALDDLDAMTNSTDDVEDFIACDDSGGLLHPVFECICDDTQEWSHFSAISA